MSERSGTGPLSAMTLEEPGGEPASPRAPAALRCGPCAVWPRQQTWLCAVPLVMGFVGLGLSLMLLKWIVVGSVQDYVPTDLVDPKGSTGQDPIFLSKPSAMPKGPDIPTTTTSASTTLGVVSTTPLLAADGTAPAPRTRTGPAANHSGNGSGANGDGNHAPHLHNRLGNRNGAAPPGTTTTTTTTRATRPAPSSGREVTPRSAVRKNSGRNVNGLPNAVSTTAFAAPTTTAETTTATRIGARGQQPTSPPSVPAKPTSRWNHGRSTKGPATRPHHRFRTPVAPTLPSPRSEVFKPCVEDKDLAFCLNEGECSIIETVAGVHRHCRCKEGYHGLRCDQFVPKTDAILSDPTDELGIEFMESGETYQRQVLSILSIASGICLLGVACMALYHHNKRHREKLRAQFWESHSLRDCSISASGFMSKSGTRPQYSLQLQKGCSSGESSFSGVGATGPSASTPPIVSRAMSKEKRFRSSSLSLSPARQPRDHHHYRTPPTSRGKNHLLDGARAGGHVYRHLQENQPADGEAGSLRRCESASGRVGALLSRTSLTHFAARKGWTEVPCTRLDRGTAFLLPADSLRTRSVPIIPSLQAEGGRMDVDVDVAMDEEGRIQFHPAPVSKSLPPVGGPPPPHPEVMAATPFAKPGSEKGPGRAPAAPKGRSKHKALSTNTLTAVTMLESEGKTTTRHMPGLLLHTESGRPRGTEANGAQWEVHGLCRGRASQETESLTGGPCAKPYAS